MNRFAVILLVSLLPVVVALGAENKRAPLPDKLVHTKTVYLENGTGVQKLADSLYSQASAWGRWEFVTDRSKADILLVLSYDENTVAVVTSGSATVVGTQPPEAGLAFPSSITSTFM